jgi:8-oxo-dGTP pyrophosphatase MutT (NUDIX family)
VTGTFDLELLRKRIREGSFPPESKEPSPVAAVAVIINPKDRGGSVLLIKRRERLGDPWSGQIAFPGGHKASGDRDYFETAIREVGEEVGIDLREHVLLGHLPRVRAHTQRIQVVPYVFELKTSAMVRLNEEVSEGFWAPLDSLEKIKSTRTEVEVEGGKLRVDAYLYDGHVIWGLTFRIINTLLDRR